MNANWMGQFGGDVRMPKFYSEVVCDGCRKHRLLFRVNQFSLCLECKIEFEENGHEAFWLKNWATPEQREEVEQRRGAE